MDKERFWKLIDEARIEDAQRLARLAASRQVSWMSKLLSRLTGSQSKATEVNMDDKISELLVEKLARMEIEEIMHWHKIFHAYHGLSYKMKLRAAAYSIGGGCSDDWFDYFRAGLVAQGKDVFLSALANPDSLADFDIGEGNLFNESMMYVCQQAFFKRAGLSDRDYDKFNAVIDEHVLGETEQQDIASDIQYAPDINREWTEEDLPSVVPKLCAKFG